MADRFYGVSLGGQLPVDVSEDSSTTSRVVELRVNDGIYSDKRAVMIAVEAILAYLQTKETRPIA